MVHKIRNQERKIKEYSEAVMVKGCRDDNAWRRRTLKESDAEMVKGEDEFNCA